MKYISTRGQAPSLSFADAVLTGLASDGGLYLPESWPKISADTMREWRDLSYPELATEVMVHFVGDDIPKADLRVLCDKAYAQFTHPAIAPLVQLEEQLWVMELFHGPTLAFKDFAMQFLGQLFEYLLTRRDEHRTIVGATSGDTGSAAIEAIRGLSHVDLYMLHPQGRVSEVQRRQMTTIQDENIHNLAVAGNFDDCQNHVKAMFNDAAFREKHQLSAVNSINWARIAAQVVYYFRAALTLGAPDKPVSFSVPSGNFGNVFAGYVAKQMGLPIEQFVVGANRNDILARFMDSGAMVAEEVVPSLSPSMDIQVSSNFERLLFELAGRDSEQVCQWMQEFRDTGRYAIGDALHQSMQESFTGMALDDEGTRAHIDEIYRATEYVLDPHSVIGVVAAQQTRRSQTPMVVLSTAHPAKFPQAVKSACGVDPQLPPRVRHIMTAEEKVENVANDLGEIQSLIDANKTA